MEKHRQAAQGLLRRGMGIRAVARECGLPVSSVYKLAKGVAGEAAA